MFDHIFAVTYPEDEAAWEEFEPMEIEVDFTASFSRGEAPTRHSPGCPGDEHLEIRKATLVEGTTEVVFTAADLAAMPFWEALREMCLDHARECEQDWAAEAAIDRYCERMDR
jgi:hypothetical protein